MTIKLQVTKLFCVPAAVVFCMLLSVPLNASENPEGSVSATAIIDQPVFHSRGQELGELEDLVIKRNGSVKKALISVGGILDMGSKLVAARYRAFEFKDEKIVLDIPKKQLADQPEFDYREHGLFRSYHYRFYPYGIMRGPFGPRGNAWPPGMHRQWQYEGMETPGRRFQKHEDENRPRDRRNYRQYREDRYGIGEWYNAGNGSYYPEKMLASVLLGQQVINKQGEQVAVVEDLLIDTEGKVKAFVFSYGGFLDIDDKQVSVPFRPVGFTWMGITYDISRREIERQPQFKDEK